MAVDCEIVYEGGSGSYSPQTYTFEALPREGEFIHLLYEGDARRFRVARVEHRAVVASSKSPTIQIAVLDAGT